MATVVLIMVAAGFLGGSVATGLSADDRNWTSWRWNLLIGLGAALLVPLFLQTVSSSLLKDLLKPQDGVQSPIDLLIFSGFALLAAISARGFITTLSDRVLREVKEAKEKAREAGSKADEARSKADEAKSEVTQAKSELTATTAVLEETRSELSDVASKGDQTRGVALAANDAVKYGLRETSSTRQATASALETIKPGPKQDDPWSGQFGGLSEANGRKVDARILAVPDRPGWCSVVLRVTSTDPARPLEGEVQFYLHPTFGDTKPVVPVREGQAVLAFTSWGAFTVGVLADGGATRLELNLAEQPDAPEPWRSR